MKGDLVAIVADGGIEQALRGILSRPKAIGIRDLAGVEILKHPERDPGVYATGHKLADLYRDTHSHALVVLDFAWEGRPSDDPGQVLAEVESKLSKCWGDAAKCVVIVPELEIWLWSDSPHVAKQLGWDTYERLRGWLESGGLWAPEHPKPADPKRAYEAAIREKCVQKSNATFFQLARSVSFGRCNDASFLRLLRTLRGWFAFEPPIAAPG